MVAPTTVPLTRRDDAFYDLKPKIAGAIRPHATWLLGLLLLPLLTSSALAATDFSDFSGFGSASSTTVSTIKIGALTDSEVSITANSTATGDDITGTDDEDGVTLPASVQIGQTRSMTVNVTNSSGATVFLNVWIDFNRNGDLTDAGEQVASNVLISTGTSNSNRTINFTVPMAAALGDAGVRVRLTSSSTPGSVGLVGNGEVEDHLLRIAPTTDFGDLSGFPIAGALADTNLRLGALVDTEIVPQLDVNAMGDDLDYTDDEDGVTVPTAVIRSDASNLVATVTNTTGATAYLNAWIDFNGNGVLTDNGEQVATNILVANGSSNSVRNLPFTVPDDAALGAVGVRVRLSSGSSPGSNTITGIGEVEDYVMTIIPPTTDFGDFAGFATASSTASATLKIGATVDTEFTADLDTTATGDDLDGTDDEDGVTLPSAIMRGQAGTMTVNISNTTGSTAFLNVWIDFNGNGVLTDAGEQVASNITLANNSVNSDRTINFTVPANALVGTVGVRTRVTSTSNPGSTGASGIGEVEDNTLVIASTADFGDYLGFASASSSLSTNLKIGALTDAELSANTDTSATGDDNDGVDDEDGVTLNPVLERGAASSLIVNVSNTLGSTAFINVWIDWNKNGVMTDAGEQIASNITVANNSINSNRLFNFTVPAGAALGTVGVRVRLTSTSSPGSVGNAGFGEVEDYIISVVTPGSSPPQTLVQQFFVPMPESQIKQSFDVLANSTGSIIDSVISIVAPVSGSRIIYDHWEDGYEADLSTPVQSTTRIWGDGSNANGIAPGFTNDPFGLPAGTVIALRNLVPLPRTSAQLYDARDRVGATQPIAMSRSAWATTPGALMADAVEVPSTAEYGTNFLMPVGENVVFPTPSSQSMFEFCSMFVMAADSGTQVQIDKDANGSFETSVTLAQGESYLVNGGVLAGARVTSTKAVQVQLFTGDINANFESRWYTIPPTADWATQYYSPVGTAANGQQTYIWLHNPDPAAITVNFLTKSSSGSFSIPAKSTYMYLMPMNSGARFTSVGSKTFFPIATVGASPTANAAYDWGFSLVPGQTLTTELVVGWGPGSDDGTANGNPVWVTAVAPTTIYVDYNGDRLGPLTDTIGGKYDVALTVGALDVSRIFEPDKDQTGLRLYTLDGTLITGAWGQDPATAGPARPFIDAGTTIPAFPMPVLSKTAAIFTDNAAAGLSVSDVMEFTVTVSNRGVASLSSITAFDSPPAGLSYVANSTKRDGVSVADSGSTPFPLDEGGQTVALLLPKASTVFKYRMTITTAGELKNVASLNIPGVRAVNTLDVPVTLTNDCAIQFTNSTGTKVNYQTGDGIYVTMTDADANTSSTTKQTVTVMMQNTSNGDVESLVLTETGNNTGVFRNLTGLPSSKTLGGSDEDGTLLALLGHTLSIVYTDPVFGGPPCSDTASFVIPSLVKQLYLSDPNQALDRRDPVATGDITMARTTVVGAATTGGTLDLNAIKDAYIKLKNSTQNFGATNKMVVDRETNDRQRALLEFDVSSIPSNATIVSAVLSLKCIRSGGTMNVNVHEVLQAWSEGTLSGTNGVVNWNQRQSGVTWTTAGGTYNSTAAATLSNPGTGTHSWNIPTLVQGWVNGSKVNNGLLIDSPDGGRDRKVEYSSLQDSTAANWPSLLVSYTIPVSTTTVTWTQAPAFASTFTMPAGTAPVVTAYYSVESGVMPASPAITATLKKGIATVATSNGTTAAGGTLTFTFPNFGSAVNLIAGDVLSLVIVNSQSGVTYTLDYDSTSVPAKISLPTSTVISVDSVGVYDAPYPGGSPVSTVENGQTRYVRAVVSDPFGAYDITSLPLSIDGPGTLNDIALTLTDANMVDRTLAAKTYEYVWETGVTPGNYTVSATAKEGFENTITDEKSTVVRLSQTDVGSPSSTRFTTGDNGPIALEYEPGQPIYVRVTDIDQNENPNVVETVTVSLLGSGGDTEVVTLTETGANTGVFTGGCPVSAVIPGTSGNGTLYVPPSSVASVTYVDQDDARDTSSATVPVTEGTDYGDHLYYSGSSASQKASADLYIGTNATDGELSDPSDANANKDDNAGRNDEDLTIPTFTIGTTTDLVIPVTIPLLSKLSGSKAQIDVWVDWNGDGLIDDIDEAESPQIISTAGTTNVTFSLTPAPSATVGTKYLRIRVTEGLIDPDFDGLSSLKGEVEDYAVSIIAGTGSDFGDFSKFSSASSRAVATLRIGALLDAESSATTNNSATGDDITGSADEEGVSLPSSAAPGATHSLTVNVNNTSGATAFLNAWIDFNNNGSLTDSGEQIATNVTVASGTVTSNRTLNFTVPASASGGTIGVRVRLTSTSTPGSTGDSGNGEVEDHLLTIAATVDFGDHSALGSASSVLSSSLRMGATVDSEGTATTNATATGDDITGIDDEDGVTLPTSLQQGTAQTMTVNLTNTTGTTAFLNAWIDYNNNGVLTDPGEQIAVNMTVATGSIGVNQPVVFNVPVASVPGDLPLRVRLTSISTAGPTGASGTGEVEDYIATITCPPVTVSPTTLAVGTAGTAYSQTVSAAGGATPFTFAVSSGTLPTGLTLNASTGVISGTPSASNGAGTTFTVRATGAFGCQGTRTYTLKVCPVISLSPTTLTNPAVGAAYSSTVSASGGATPYVFGLASGSLPEGLALNASTGEISGVATNAAATSFTVSVADANGCPASRAYTLTPACPAVTLTTATLPNGTVASAYSQTLAVAGGTAPYSFVINAGALPPGLSLDGNTGEISGTPTSSAAANFTVLALDIYGCAGSRAYTVTPACPPVIVTPSTLPVGTVGSAYSQLMSASGGIAPYSFALSSGTLPTGLTLSTAGFLSGTPTVSNGAGGSITVRATDSAGCQGTVTISLKICPVPTLSPTTLTNPVVGTPYSGTVTPSGGASPYTFSIASGSLPAGLTLNTSTGEISGTATSSTTANFTVSAVDANGCPGTRAYTVTPVCAVITVSPSTVPVGTVGTAYSQTMSATGGTAPYTYAISSGTLPAGLSLNSSTGEISGTPTTSNGAGTAITVRATDSATCQGTRSLTLQICPVITLAPTTLATPTVGTAYSDTITPSGGAPPYVFSLASGALPAGLTLDTSTGVISGTATSATTANFTVRAVDANSCAGTQAYTVTPVCPTITINPASLTNAVQYAAYSSTTLTATNGTAPYTWSVSAGALPTGLTLSSAGVLSGTATAAPGTYNFTARALDAYNCAGTRAYSLVVVCNVIAIAPTTLPKAYYNTNYEQELTATLGTAPYTWTVIAGAPPPGITLSTAGVLSGSSIVYGDANFTVRATDVNGCTNTRALLLTVKGLSIGDLVYDDVNFNGMRDPGEPGVPDVTVQLWSPGADEVLGGSGADADVQIGASITTDVDGGYLFEDLPPGWYFVRVIPTVELPYRGGLPVNLDNGIDNDNNAALQPGGRGTVITGPLIDLEEDTEPVSEDADADTDLTLDFGLFAGLRVGNLVWADTNDNGLHDLGETGLNGVLVEIWNTGADGQIGGGDDDRLATTTTAGGGLYSFADLPPESLYVRIPAPPVGHPLASSVTSQSGDDDDNDGYQVSAGAVYSGIIDMAAVATTGNYLNNTVDFGFIPVAAPSVYLSATQADGVHVFNGSTGLFNGALNHPFGTSLSQGTADGDDVPHGMELGPDGNWYVAHPAVGNLRKIAANGTDLGVALDNVTAGISAIRHFAIGPDRNFYVVDATGDRVVRFHGPFSGTPGAPLGAAPYTFISQAGISDLNFGPDGNLYVLVENGAAREIRRYDATSGALMNLVATAVQVAGAAGGGDANPQVSGFDIYDSVLYGVNNTDGEVFSIDLTDPSAPGLPQVIATIASAGKGTVDMRDIEFNPASSELFMAGFQWGKPVGGAAYASGALVRVDVSGAPNGTVSVFEDPIPAPPGPNDETWSGPRDLAIGRPYAPLPETVAIGSLVWHDADADGQQGLSEPGIAGVRVELWHDANNNVADGAETRIGWTFTDANGHYYFSGQAPGLYQVKIPSSNFGAGMPLEGTGYSSPLSSTVDDQIDGDDSGRQFGGFKAIVVSPLITLTPGAEPLGDGMNGAENGRGGELDNYTVDANGDMTVDFGFVEPGIMGIGNLVFTDANENNLFDSGEGTDGVVVELYRWGRTPGLDDPVATTVTAGGGLFLFSSLWQGQYFIHLPAPQFESGANLNGLFSLPGFSTGDDDTGEDSLDAVEPWITGISSGLISLVRDQAPTDSDTETGHDSASDLDDLNINLTIDIGLFRAVEVGNLVFEDYNSSGTYDAGEGKDAVLLELYTDTQFPGVDTPVAVTSTDANGLYRFRFLRPGSYIVHIPVSQFEPGGALYQRTSIYEGLTGDDDVGEDGINNGDALDNGVSSGVVHLLVGLTPTDESGETGADAASDNQIDASVDLTVDFGFQIPVGVGNLVYVDSNDNGRADAGEGVDGVYVELYRSDQTPGTSFPIFTRITAGGGKYFFDALAEGDYVLHIPASQFDPGRPLFGMESSPGASSVAAALDDDVTGNENGLDDYLPFVNGISTAVFTLAVDVSPTAATGETGMFADIDDSDDNNYNLTIDFGFKAVDPDAVGVGNLVFLDLNGNGAHDEGEGVNGVQVQLFAAAADPLIAAPLATLTTSDGGYYFFRNLAAGDYQVFIPPSEFAPGKPLFGWSSIPGDGGDFGIDDNQDENGIDVVDPATTGVASSAFNLTPGEEPTNSLGEFGANAYMDDLNDANADLTIDFGFTHPVAVGNLVFIDANANGHADLGEGVEGVTLELYTEGMWPLFEAPVATTVTVADGSYRFDNLSPDHYFVRISPSQFGFGMPLFGQASMLGVQLGDDDTGEDGIDDGQASYNGIQSSVFELSLSGSPTGSQESGYLGSSDDAADAAIDLTIDFGFVSQIAVGNLVFHDINNDGVFDPNTEYGVDGVTVELWSSDPGATLPVGSTSTFGGGSYRFDVAPGSYYIRIPASNFGVFGVLANRSPSQATIAGDDDVGQDAYIDGTLLSNGARTAVFTLVRDSTPTDADTETGYLSYEDDFDDANSDLTVDLGFTANPLSVGNLVFRDLNVNGVYDASDYGIPDVPVRLYNVGDDPTSPSSVPVMVTTTASDGSFLLTTYLEGTYFMHIPPSAFAAFAPLDSHVSTPSFGADDGADDDAGEDGIDAAEPAVTGINSTSFDLIYGTEPIDEATETGFQAASDNGNDADTDLTIDFGFVLGSGSPSGSSMRRNLSDGNTTNTTASAPSTFAAWQTQNSMAGLNNPNDDPDADGLTNLMEYALGSAADNALGVSRFRLERNATTGAIDALLTRPAGEHNDLRYTIELGSDLVAWSALNRTPTVQNGADQTVTLRYADVAAAFNGAAQGFLRLKVTLDADLDGVAEASAVTRAQGWAQPTFQAGRQSLSMPLLRAAIFTGKVSALNGSTATLSNTGGSDIRTYLQTGVSYYAEVLDGALAGRTFDLDSTNSSGSTIRLTTSASTALIGARISLRPHHTLGGLLPVADMQPALDQNDADRVMFFDTAQNNFQIYWLHAGTDTAQWVRDGDTTLADASARIIPPLDGMLVQLRSTPVTFTFLGEVRTVALVLPQTAGTHLIGTSLATPQTPGAQPFTSGSRLRLWSGDADPASTTYQNYLLNPQSQWIDEATGTNVTTQPLLDACRAFFLVKP